MILDWIPCHKPGREEKKSQATTTTKKRERDLFKVVVVEYLNNHVIILSFLFAEDARRTSRRLCGCVRGLPEKWGCRSDDRRWASHFTLFDYLIFILCVFPAKFLCAHKHAPHTYPLCALVSVRGQSRVALPGITKTNETKRCEREN